MQYFKNLIIKIRNMAFKLVLKIPHQIFFNCFKIPFDNTSCLPGMLWAVQMQLGLKQKSLNITYFFICFYLSSSWVAIGLWVLATDWCVLSCGYLYRVWYPIHILAVSFISNSVYPGFPVDGQDFFCLKNLHAKWPCSITHMDLYPLYGQFLLGERNQCRYH